MPEITFGFPRMHKEPGEKRDFLPSLIGRLHRLGVKIMLEHGYGAEMGIRSRDYYHVAPSLRFASRSEVYQQEYVLVLRCPNNDELHLLRPGSCLISMLHYPTRPRRVEFLRSLQIEAISLDSLKDDSGRRMVENLKAVGWNGTEIAFQTLKKLYPPPGFEGANRSPIRATILGPGAVGMHAIQAAVHYGNPGYREQLAAQNVPGVQVTSIDYDLTNHKQFMKLLLKKTDILIDATQRPSPANPVIPNAWIQFLPKHAVLLDLSVDPYVCEGEHISVKGIEGIPQGNLDHYIFSPDDPAYNLIPSCTDTTHRRWAVSCYSWPGINPRECMEVYGKQIQPILRILLEKGGVQAINPRGQFFERVIGRAMLTHWQST
jgi:alanine dehydrogenase